MRIKQPNRLIALIMAFCFLYQAGFAGTPVEIATLKNKVDQNWTESATTRTRVVRDEAGKVVFQRTYDKATGKALPGIVASEAALVPVSDQSKTKATGNAVATKAKDKDKTKPKAKTHPETWTKSIEWQARFQNSTKNQNHTYQELFNEHSGVGIKKLDVSAVSDSGLFKFRTESLGTWNRSMGSQLEYHHQGDVHVRAKYRQTEWDFGTVLDPKMLRETFTLDATLDKSEQKWRPRYVFSYRGEDRTGKILRVQGNIDQNPPRDRTWQSWDPFQRNMSLAVFAGHQKLDFSLTYADRYSRDSNLKVYQRDIDFNGVKDLMQIWNWQRDNTQTLSGKAKYQFNEKYSFTAGVTGTNTDSEYDTIRNQYDAAGLLTSSANMTNSKGADHGSLDGSTNLEEYVFSGQPNDLWDIEARIERRRLKTSGNSLFRYGNYSGVLTGTDHSVVRNEMTEGLMEFRADYYGSKKTPVYFGYRSLDREEVEKETLGVYSADVLGNLAITASPRAEFQDTRYDFTEKMGYLGLRHRFNSRLSLDVRHEAGAMTDSHDLNRGADLQPLPRGYDKTRQALSLRADPGNDLHLVLKLRRDLTDRRDMHANDDRKSYGLFANWAPHGKKYTIGTGYTRTTGDFSLTFGRFRDDIETLSFNTAYRFNARWRANLDLSQSVSGNTTRLDYQMSQLQVIRQLDRGREASLGYARRFYDDLNVASEKFTNQIVYLSYSLPL